MFLQVADCDPRVDVVDRELVTIHILDDVSQECSLADASLPDDNNRDVLTDSLCDETHLEEVVEVYNISRL